MTDLLPPTQLGRSGRLESVLASLLATAPELEAAAVVSFDGLPMASALPEGMDEDRVAAMSAALLSLGDRAAQGLGRGDLSQVYVEGRTAPSSWCRPTTRRSWWPWPPAAPRWG